MDQGRTDAARRLCGTGRRNCGAPIGKNGEVRDGYRIVMTLAFYPRGGSAQVVRYLGGALQTLGNDVTVACGSLGPPGVRSHAGTFFDGLDVQALDFTEAIEWFDGGRDPMKAPVPIHPSFEDRPGVPDRVFASVADDAYQLQVAAWQRLLEDVGPPDVYHVHHLTHVNDAIDRIDTRPVIAHLHGTELKMLEQIRGGGAERWSQSSAWDLRLVAAAHRADRLIVISKTDRDLAIELVNLDPAQIDIVPNGVDTSTFVPLGLSAGRRLEHWRQWLVEDPQGWDESGLPGKIRYTNDDIERFFIGANTGELRPVLLYVGRFLDFKRVPLLIRAYAEVRSALGNEAPPLVVWGGYPGEWEGEHPHSVARALGVEGVFFVGWHGHDELAIGFNCADVFVAPSVEEPFGQVYLEAMACGMPVIATTTGGPPSFVNTDPGRLNGWLVAPDEIDALANAMVEAAVDTLFEQNAAEMPVVRWWRDSIGFGSLSESTASIARSWPSARHAARSRRGDPSRLGGDVDERRHFGSDGRAAEVSRNGIRPRLHHELETVIRVRVELRGIVAEECQVVGHRHGAVPGCCVGTPNPNNAGMMPERDSSVRRCRSRAVDFEHHPCCLDTVRYRYEHCPGILARLSGRVRGIPTWNPRSFPSGVNRPIASAAGNATSKWPKDCSLILCLRWACAGSFADGGSCGHDARCASPSYPSES